MGQAIKKVICMRYGEEPRNEKTRPGPRIGFFERFIRSRQSQPTARRFSEYADALRLGEADLENLRGKRVLDIGAGASNFSQECNRRGIFAVALDPMARRAMKAHDLGPKFASESRLVAGVAEALPFADESLDLIVSMNSALAHPVDMPVARQFLHPSKMDAEATLEAWSREYFESLRALRRGGEMRIYPYGGKSGAEYTPLLDKVLEKIRESGFDIKIMPQNKGLFGCIRITKAAAADMQKLAGLLEIRRHR